MGIFCARGDVAGDTDVWTRGEPAAAACCCAAMGEGYEDGCPKLDVLDSVGDGRSVRVDRKMGGTGP